MPIAAHARRLVLLLAALVALVVAAGAGLVIAPATHAASAQNRVRSFTPAAQLLVGGAASQSACSRPGSTLSAARTTVGFCVAAEGGVDIGGANFAQKTYGESFSSGGRFAGQSIDDVAGALQSGELSPADVPIEVINRNGNSLILNTRSAQALERAGIPRSEWNVVNVTGNPAAEARLSGQFGSERFGSSGYPYPTSSGG